MIDIRLPPTTPTRAPARQPRSRRRIRGTGVLVLSQHVETRTRSTWSHRGGFGYLLKDRVLDVDDFLAARAGGPGGSALDPYVVGHCAPDRGRRGLAGPHRARARGAALMAQGLTNAGVAKRLFSANARSRRTSAACSASSTSPTATTPTVACWPC